MVQLEQYRIFASVANNKSFSKAADELFITQPAVSQSIKSLEKELGAVLFVRSSRRVQLTEAGQTLYECVSQALSLINRAEAQFHELKTLEYGTLKIGASDTLCQHYLLPHLKAFHKKYPHVNISVTNRTSRETVELLRHGKVDIGFINMPTALDSNIEVIPLKELHDCFVYSQKHFPYIKSPADYSILKTLPILMLENESSTRTYINDFFNGQNITLTPEIELGSHDLLLSFAEIGLGIAAVVEEYSKAYIGDKLSKLEFHQEIPSRSIALIYRRNIPLTFAANEFTKLLLI